MVANFCERDPGFFMTKEYTDFRHQLLPLFIYSSLDDFIDTITILYPNEKSFSIFRRLLKKYEPAGLKIHDFEIISIGLAYNINQIATNDLCDFKNIEEINLIPL